MNFLCINPNGKSIIFTIHKLVNNTIAWVYLDTFGCCLDPNIKCCMARFYLFGLKLTWVFRLFVFGLKKRYHLRTFHIMFIVILLTYFNFCISKKDNVLDDGWRVSAGTRCELPIRWPFFPVHKHLKPFGSPNYERTMNYLEYLHNLVLKINLLQKSHLNKIVIF